MLLESPGKNQYNRTTSYFNKRPLRKQKAYAAEEDTDDDGEEIVGLVTKHVLFANRRSNWVVDSGATCKMCNNEAGCCWFQPITEGESYSHEMGKY